MGLPVEALLPSISHINLRGCNLLVEVDLSFHLFLFCSRVQIMAALTEIEWTDATWNPVTGCTKITRGCELCYAERFAERFRGVPGHPFESGFDLKLRPERLTQPLSWRQPRRIFVNSMSDLFHKEVPGPFIDSVFDTMEAADWHTFQVLTKRSSLMVRYLRNRYDTGKAPTNIWLGVSVEDAKNSIRVKHLQTAAASVRFVSFEPLLGSVGKVDLKGIDWAIVGGESGPRARPMAEEWAIEIRDQCRAAKVAFFFKQWGGVRPKSGGRLLKGREWNQYPNISRELRLEAAE
jgi:protein gp37